MKIIIPGTVKNNKPMDFLCDKCGCKFIADAGEWQPENFPMRSIEIEEKMVGSCKCPACNQWVFKWSKEPELEDEPKKFY